MMGKTIEELIGNYQEEYDYHGTPVLMTYSVPFFMSVVENGKQKDVFYASYSKNRGFGTKKMNEVIQQDFNSAFMETFENTGDYLQSFRYLLNIQKVANRVIDDLRKLYNCKKITNNQAVYIHDQMQILIKKNRDVCRTQKSILETLGYDVNKISCSSGSSSKVCQQLRISRAIRLLRLLKVL